MDVTNRNCPWCSTPIPSTADACPKCGALVEGAIAKDLPGITVVDPTAKLGVPDEGLVPDIVDPKALLKIGVYEAPINEEALLPPSEAVRSRKLCLKIKSVCASMSELSLGFIWLGD